MLIWRRRDYIVLGLTGRVRGFTVDMLRRIGGEEKEERRGRGEEEKRR